MLRDFKLPEGASGDDIDANGDGEVLAVLDLGTDESLVEAGLAREVVNRVQKLRKKAGLVASDVVDVFLNTTQQNPGWSLSHYMSVLEYMFTSHHSSFRKLCKPMQCHLRIHALDGIASGRTAWRHSCSWQH